MIKVIYSLSKILCYLKDIWKFYDFGPKDENNIPLVFLPSVAGN